MEGTLVVISDVQAMGGSEVGGGFDCEGRAGVGVHPHGELHIGQRGQHHEARVSIGC